MLRHLAILLAFIIIIPELISANDKCPRRLKELEAGRKCRKACKKDKDCKGGNKGCHCDGACGMSCFNNEAECSPPPPLENGNVILDSLVYGSTISYECNEGYVLVGERTRICQSDKEWSGESPACEVGCSRPPTRGVAFTTSGENGFKVGTVVTYKCRFGYNQVGNDEVECLKNYTWSEPQFQCIKLSCGNPGEPVNGYIEGNDFSFGSWVSFQCNKGFINDNPRQSRIHCSSTGRWSGEPITCSKLKCDPPVGPENGFVDITGLSLEFKSLVNYNCDFGYKLEGNRQGECNEDGNWGELPICTVDVNCNFDGVDNPLCGYTNGGEGVWERQFESQNTKSGNPSYVLRATSTPAVLRSPVISSFNKHCFQFSYYISLVLTDDSLAINTQNGRTKVGGVWTQERSFRWQTQQLTIDPLEIFGGIQFEINLLDDGTEVELDDFSLQNGACETKCPPDTCLNGGTCIDRVEDYECLCDRSHKGRNCEILITCPDLPPLQSGSFEISPDPTVFRVDTKIEFSCDEGYTLVGPSIIECLQDGTWSKSKRTKCKEILCTTPSRLQRGFRDIQTNTPGKMSIGTVVTYSCPIGMFLFAKEPIIVCRKDGKWSGGGQGVCAKQTPRSLTSTCPIGFRNEGTMCYRVVEDKTNFTSASSLCSMIGATLAIIRSAKERKRVEKLINQKRLYYVGLTNTGREDYVWADGEDFNKIASERYGDGFDTREDITTKSKCGVFLKFSGRTSILAYSCSAQRRFICHTFSLNVVPVKVIVEDPQLDEADGIYRPVLGLEYNQAIVYKQESGEGENYLFRVEMGWTIGRFNVTRTRPFKGKDVVNTNSTVKFPQNIIDDWTIGSMQILEGEKANITIVKYDLWTQWTSWSPCTKSCGTGTKRKTRKCLQKDGSPGYGDCIGEHVSERECSTKQCIITRWGDWTSWSRCTVPCGGGVKNRSRICIKDPENFEICVGNAIEETSCNLKACKPGTTEWSRFDIFEYRIIVRTRTYNDSEEECGKDNGALATIDDIESLEFLTKMVEAAHCRSSSAYSIWQLWVAERVEADSENVTDEIDVNEVDTPNKTRYCQSVTNECGSDKLSWSTEECMFPKITGRICERVWRPCNSNPCGNGGECTNVDEETYRCDCFDNYQGSNCELEMRCSVEKLKKLYKVLYAENGKSVQESSIEKGLQISLGCSREKQVPTGRRNYRCVGLETWDAKKEPGVICENTCSLPKGLGRNITVKFRDSVVKEGEAFPVDSLLVLECPDSMEFVGEKSALCTEEGWDVKMDQRCESPTVCEEPTAPEHGTLEIEPKQKNTFLKSGVTVTLHCADSYTLIGLTKVTCGNTGNWSGDLGRCERKPGCELDLQGFSDDAVALDSVTYNEYKTNINFEVDQTVDIFCDNWERGSTLRQFKCTERGWKPDIFSYCPRV